MTQLTTEIATARDALSPRIDIGRAILALSGDELREAEQKWYDHNNQLLLRLFNDSEINAQYNSERDPSGDHTQMVAGRPRLTWIVTDLIREPLLRQIYYLESLVDRIHLFQISDSVRGHATIAPYVDNSRLISLRAATVRHHDLTRLIRLCEELNIAWESGTCHAVIMLLRAIIDHVPPLFGVSSFAGIANNYGGAKSFREAAATLDSAARKIADLHLHAQVGEKEVLPNRTQGNFSQQLDLLLAEILRLPG